MSHKNKPSVSGTRSAQPVFSFDSSTQSFITTLKFVKKINYE